MKFLLNFLLFLSFSSAQAGVSFIQPKNKATVPPKFKVAFDVKGMTIARAGNFMPGMGHHHLIIDGKSIPEGFIVPKNSTHFHFGDGSTSTMVTLTPGKHTLTLQFADGIHKSLGPKWSKTITVNVKMK